MPPSHFYSFLIDGSLLKIGIFATNGISNYYNNLTGNANIKVASNTLNDPVEQLFIRKPAQKGNMTSIFYKITKNREEVFFQTGC